MKKLQYTIIDTAGQWTPILEGTFSAEEKAEIGQELLAKYPLAGQVAFVAPDKGISMMGGELSINGTIAGKYYLEKYTEQRQMRVNFPKSIIKHVLKDEVILSGIKYRLVKTKVEIQTARKYCGTDLACGFIIEKNPGEIIPMVYVKATDTLITETACGSASLAYALLTGITEIKQLSGNIITSNVSQSGYNIGCCVKIVKKITA